MKMKMVSWVIFTYILLIGCEDVTHSVRYLNIDAPNLTKINGFYEMIHLSDYIQTFTTISAETGSFDEYQKLKWISNKEINIEGYWINPINKSSYTDENGDAYTTFSAWEEFINDTITVYCGYHDEYSNHYVDSLKIIVKGN